MAPPGLESELAAGLSEPEAARRLANEGANDLPAPGRHSPLELIFEVVREPMFAFLLGSAVLYALIGDLGEALLLAGFATVSVSIAIVQRGRSERVLEALRDLTSPRALVIRAGQRRRVPGREVVRGDVLVLTEGDRVPADALLMDGADIRADESLLTGESVPVRKRPATVDERLAGSAVSTPGGDDLPHLFSGTLILRGTGLAIVTATGVRSEIGKIGRAVGGIEPEQPRLRAQTKRLVLLFAILGVAASGLAILLYGIIRGNWLEALLGGIALGMSMLPEEFPLVLTVFMVMGAWRLSRSRVLTRRAAAIETLGAATVLCTDKTGTLTRNAMSVVGLEAAEASWRRGAPLWKARDGATSPSDSALTVLLQTAVLASERHALDPMERAIHELATEAGVQSEAPSTLVRAYPLRPELLAVTQVWDAARERIVAAKGAPEAIARLCRLDDGAKAALMERVDVLARAGMRVLGVAHGRCGYALPDSPTELGLDFIGLVALADPLRESVPQAVAECRSAGIRVVMITGDYSETARAIAREAGIAAGETLTGQELADLDEATLARKVREITVFARITPSQKLRIVEALKAAGEVVAMTGDGVNDAPALKAAHIGIAMGGRGTDVAREAAALVLLDDDFGSIVQAVRLGRRIYDNLRKTFGYILSVHLPIAGLALLPILMGWPLLLTPVLIAFLELIIDPACSIVLEAEHSEADLMKRPPRDPRSPLVPRSLAMWCVVQGALAFIAVATIYVAAIHRGLPHEEVRAVAFVTLVAANLALIFASRTFDSSLRSALMRPNPLLGWGVVAVSALLAAVVSWPAVRKFFGLALPSLPDVLISLGAALALLAVLQWLKRFRPRED